MALVLLMLTPLSTYLSSGYNEVNACVMIPAALIFRQMMSHTAMIGDLYAPVLLHKLSLD